MHQSLWLVYHKHSLTREAARHFRYNPEHES